MFFENTRCLNCGRNLGFIPELMAVCALESVGHNRWRALDRDEAALYRMCSNYDGEKVCNWMVADEEPTKFCNSCRLNEIIPELGDARNRVLWHRLEIAKRRLLYTLYQLGLPVVSREQDAEYGLAFRFLANQDQDTIANEIHTHCAVVTGHQTGLITINIAEADPAAREKIRESMNEQYRTVLGHFRHEIGHYYWDRLIRGTRWLQNYRALFGDERLGYEERLGRYYANGAAVDWSDSYVSEYASSHPWEDWAETWAHYLHIVDTLDTAHDRGVAVGGKPIDSPSGQGKESDFRRILDEWGELTVALNSLNRSMGQPDLYPFSLSPKVLDKLCFVHDVVTDTTPARNGVTC